MIEEPANDIWKDPQVQEALRNGRMPNDVAVLRCPSCDKLGYYNQGSYFSCRFCGKSWYVCTEDEEPPEGRAYMRVDCHTSLDDTVTETTEGYDNRTL